MSTPPGDRQGFGPPHPSYRLSISDPEPAPAPPVDPARLDLGPAPRRSRTGLLLQYVGQYLYIPIWVLALLVLVVILIMADANDVPGGDGLFAIGPSAISWRRFRAEWTGRPADWEQPVTLPELKRVLTAAESRRTWSPSEVPPSGVRRVTARLPVRYYRGLGAGRVAQLAAERGWSADWENSRAPHTEMRFVRFLPPPAPPASLTGPGWDPLPTRLLVPLLTLPLRPKVRMLELRRDPKAYREHVAAWLDARIRAELGRDPKRGYRAEDGAILRRVMVTAAHYRGLGAREVLRLAEERGWTLDPTFAAEPESCLRVCRPDRVDGRPVG